VYAWSGACAGIDHARHGTSRLALPKSEVIRRVSVPARVRQR
jgi:hypothetical protein